MLLDLPGARRDRLLFICQPTVRALIILIPTVSCSGPGADMPPPSVGVIDLFSGGVTDAPKQRLVQQDGAHPKVRKGQPKASASPKVATEHAPKVTNRSVPRPASKKADTPPRLDAQREEQLYQEFLEWQSRQKDLP